MRRTGAMKSLAGALLVFLMILLGSGLVCGGCVISGYNHVVRLDEQVKRDWAQVETQLQRRFDLVPNLVETVRGYAEHEKELFENIAASRTQYFQARGSGDQTEQVAAANGMERALSRLLVLQERYPELKAQESFAGLMDELSGTENRVALERKRYNDAVAQLNTYRRTFFGQLVAQLAGVGEATFYQPPAEVHEAPKVDFSKGG